MFTTNLRSFDQLPKPSGGPSQSQPLSFSHHLPTGFAPNPAIGEINRSIYHQYILHQITQISQNLDLSVLDILTLFIRLNSG